MLIFPNELILPICHLLLLLLLLLFWQIVEVVLQVRWRSVVVQGLERLLELVLLLGRESLHLSRPLLVDRLLLGLLQLALFDKGRVLLLALLLLVLPCIK